MVNPLTLYEGLRASDSSVTLLKTSNCIINGDSKCELSIQVIGSELDKEEKQELLRIYNVLHGVIEIQKELN